MDMRLTDSENDERSCDDKDVTKLPWTVAIEDLPSGKVAESDEQGDVTKLPWTTPVNG